MDDSHFRLATANGFESWPAVDDGLDALERPVLLAEIGRLRAEVAELTARTTNLEIGIQSSREIGAALGIVMVTYRVTNEHAFAMLTELSQHTNRKIREIAADIVFTGAMPDAAPDVPSDRAERP